MAMSPAFPGKSEAIRRPAAAHFKGRAPLPVMLSLDPTSGSNLLHPACGAARSAIRFFWPGIGERAMQQHLGHFGDSRLRDGGADLLARLMEVGPAGARLRPLGGDRAGEVRFGRFLHNANVTSEEMITTAAAHTAGLVAGLDVLAIQDTTTMRDDGDQNSLNLHVMIAVDARDGAMLGPVHAEFLRHEGGKRADRGKRAFEEKESFRWLAATREAAKLVTDGAARVTVVADRECDIYDEFALRPPETELLIRARHDRKLADGRWLFSCTRRLPELGRETISLPAAPGRPARDAVIALRACPVTLKRPMRNRAADAAKLPPKVDMTLVEAREVRPPRNVTPAHWFLLTTHAVSSFTDTRRITRWYRARWTIEQVNRTMKSEGFRIETSRVADGGPFEKLAVAVLIAAVQVMQLVGDRDGTAGRPLEDVFEPADRPALEAICATLEGSTARQKNPHKRGSLAYGTWVCARLAGWTVYYGKPGPVVILRGLLLFKAMRHGCGIAHLMRSGPKRRHSGGRGDRQ
jgi:hypothetical protein